MQPPKNTSTLTLRPIGHIRTVRELKFQAPSQPDPRVLEESVIELDPGSNFEQALSDLGGFDRVWLVWWFHRNTTWRPKVLPPRGPGVKRGVFATRSPHRPNPIGISAVELVRVVGRRLYVGSNDLLDGTPILDVKPYLPEVDSFPESSIGWLGEVAAEFEGPPRYGVRVAQEVQNRLEWLATEWGITILPRVREILERDPSPHRTRRIVRCEGARYRIGCGAWRMFFRVEGEEILIDGVEPGYPSRALTPNNIGGVPHGEAQLAFLNRWP